MNQRLMDTFQRLRERSEQLAAQIAGDYERLAEIEWRAAQWQEIWARIQDAETARQAIEWRLNKAFAA